MHIINNSPKLQTFFGISTKISEIRKNLTQFAIDSTNSPPLPSCDLNETTNHETTKNEITNYYY